MLCRVPNRRNPDTASRVVSGDQDPGVRTKRCSRGLSEGGTLTLLRIDGRGNEIDFVIPFLWNFPLLLSFLEGSHPYDFHFR